MIGERMPKVMDRNIFRNTAYKTNTLNFRRTNMRGGIRL